MTIRNELSADVRGITFLAATGEGLRGGIFKLQGWTEPWRASVSEAAAD